MLRVLSVLLMILAMGAAAQADMSGNSWRPVSLPRDGVRAPEMPPLESNSVEVQVLLSSVEMSMRLLDAYGLCREDGRDHAGCMGILRSSLDEALTQIGR